MPVRDQWVPLVLLLALALVLPVLYPAQVEPSDRTVALAVDLAVAQDLAHRVGIPLPVLVEHFASAGANALLIHERTLGELEKGRQVVVRSAEQLVAAQRLGGTSPLPGGREPQAGRIYVFTERPETVGWLMEAWRRQHPGSEPRLWDEAGRPPVIELATAYLPALDQPLAIFPGDLELARNLGLLPVIAINQRPGTDRARAQSILEAIPRGAWAVYFTDRETPAERTARVARFWMGPSYPFRPYSEVLGYPDLSGTSAWLSERDLRLVIDTNQPQRGRLELADRAPLVRARELFPWDRPAAVAREVARQQIGLLLWAPEEPPKETSAATDLALNRTRLESLVAALQTAGWRVGEPGAHTAAGPSAWQLVLVVWVTALGASMFGGERRRRWSALVVGLGLSLTALAWLAPVYRSAPVIGLLVVATFAVLAARAVAGFPDQATCAWLALWVVAGSGLAALTSTTTILRLGLGAAADGRWLALVAALVFWLVASRPSGCESWMARLVSVFGSPLTWGSALLLLMGALAAWAGLAWLSLASALGGAALTGLWQGLSGDRRTLAGSAAVFGLTRIMAAFLSPAPLCITLSEAGWGLLAGFALAALAGRASWLRRRLSDVG
ncbi:MAG: DUF5693 family protein [Bacillota bacterium]